MTAADTTPSVDLGKYHLFHILCFCIFCIGKHRALSRDVTFRIYLEVGRF